MKKIILQFGLVLFSTFAFSQAGHIMQGVGAFNMSMGGGCQKSFDNASSCNGLG
jgi:hypothetical protein